MTANEREQLRAEIVMRVTISGVEVTNDPDAVAQRGAHEEP